MLPHQRAINRVERRWRRNAALHQLWDLGPATVYAGLLAYAKARGWKDGWAFHAFQEVYGAKPRPQDRNGESEPLADLAVERWATTRKPKPRRRVQR
jgi:hypothetical protein